MINITFIAGVSLAFLGELFFLMFSEHCCFRCPCLFVTQEKPPFDLLFVLGSLVAHLLDVNNNFFFSFFFYYYLNSGL